MPTVAELGVIIDAEDRATATLARLDALISSMEGDDVNIGVDADAREAFLELNSVKRLLDELNRQRATTEVDADTAMAQAALDAVDAVMKDLDGDTADISVDADTAMAFEQLTLIDGLIEQIEGQNVDVDADVDAAVAHQLRETEHFGGDVAGHLQFQLLLFGPGGHRGQLCHHFLEFLFDVSVGYRIHRCLFY